MDYKEMFERLKNFVYEHRVHVLRVECEVRELYTSLVDLQDEFERIEALWNQK